MDNSYGSDADTGTVRKGIPWRNDGVPQWNLREEASLLTFTASGECIGRRSCAVFCPRTLELSLFSEPAETEIPS